MQAVVFFEKGGMTPGEIKKLQAQGCIVAAVKDVSKVRAFLPEALSSAGAGNVTSEKDGFKED